MKLTNQQRILVFSAVVILVLAFSWWLDLRSEQIRLSSETRNFDNSLTEFIKLDWRGNDFYIPESLPIYTAEAIEVEQLEAKLRTDFGLPEVAEKLNLWQGNEYILAYYPEENQYLLSLGQQKKPSDTFVEEIAKSEAMRLVSSLAPEAKLIIDDTQTKFFSGSFEQEQVTKQLADFVEYNLVQKLQDYPVFIKNQTRPPLSILLDGSGTLFKAVIRPSFFKFSLLEGAELKVWKINEALKQIEKGEGQVLSYHTTATDAISLNGRFSGYFIEANIEYRLTDVNGKQLVTPFYHFKGTLFGDSRKQIGVDVVVPAVNLSQISAPR